ncbi:MAG TPA: hypothetical protein VFW44_20235 [Bryobacteraceae bacterium]|nr:hypothetical protein [Bryobacteraceae bacterium]
MNLMPSNLGADPKKIGILVGLVVVAGFAYFYNSNSGGGDSGSTAVARRTPTSTTTLPRPSAPSTFRSVKQGVGTREFRPSMKPRNIDPATIDPTLRLDLLAKLRDVEVEPGVRSPFEIGAAPPAQLAVKEPAKIAVARPFVGPVMPPPPPPAPVVKAPPIPLKFYGFVNKTRVGDKRAFFLDGEDIVIASEGDTIKKRYKIVHIGISSAVVEDTEFKSNNQQTLPLEAELTG